ncbi:B-cell linker protein isoform X2 [Hypomesus transpacificus]|uniref:B-cell linker protein isoform X2 n=1 Tax=Hypomesus transpacificus TaxID=137520 RepID=UPI001F07390F|nr:B-cell linker protein isoform X2 [Hypomesus transpacificus]
MERNKRGNKAKQKHHVFNNMEATQYHTADDLEKIDVQIRPARPPLSETEYTDRDIRRRLTAKSLYPESAESHLIHTRFANKEQAHNPGPAVNRQLKPGRGRTPLDGKMQVVKTKDKNIEFSKRSPRPLSSGLVPLLSEMELKKPCMKKTNIGIKNEVCETSSDLQSTESNYPHRYSLDLEHPDMRLQERHIIPESTSRRRQNHEWPPIKGDLEQHDFVSKEKPTLTHKKDWYIGACERSEAEHALHLVNRDGAFLVRNSSKNSPSEPYVLVVLHEKRVYNVKIRFIDSTCKYALGTGQRSNDMFDSVADIIKFHSIFPVSLIDGRTVSTNTFQRNCVLMYPITKEDLSQLLI